MNKSNRKPTVGRDRAQVILLVLGILLIASNLRAALTSVGPLVGEIRADTALSNTFTGMLTTLPLIAFAVLSPLAPQIARRFGMERVLFVSLIALTIGIMLRSVPSAISLFTGTAILGLSIAVGNVLLPSLIKREFPDRVGLMTGVYSLSMSIWAAVASGLSVPLTHGLGLGWRGALVCWAILSAVAAIIWLPQLRSNRKTIALQLQPASETSGHLLRSPLAWQVTIFMGMQSLAFYTTVAWLPEILREKGISVTSSGWLLSLMLLVGLPSSFIVPILAGRRANQQSFVLASAILYLIGVVGLLVFGSTLVSLWIVLIGFSQGACISLAFMLFVLRAQNARQAAELSGMAQSVGYLLAAIGPTLFGFLHDLTHSWTSSLIILIAVILILLGAGIGAGRSAYVISDNANNAKKDVPTTSR